MLDCGQTASGCRARSGICKERLCTLWATGHTGQGCSISGQLAEPIEPDQAAIQPLALLGHTPITSADELLEKANVAEPKILKKKIPVFFLVIKLHKFPENLSPSSYL